MHKQFDQLKNIINYYVINIQNFYLIIISTTILFFNFKSHSHHYPLIQIHSNTRRYEH
jgi:hypothetical protein